LSQFVDRWLDPPVLADVQQLGPIASELGLSLAQLAIAWVLQNGNVASAIVGASTPEHLKQAAAVSDTILPVEVMTAVERVMGRHAATDPAANPFNWASAPENFGRG